MNSAFISGKANAFVIIQGPLVEIPFLLAVTRLVSVGLAASDVFFFFCIEGERTGARVSSKYR